LAGFDLIIFGRFWVITEARYAQNRTEILVATTKHFEVWLNDAKLFRSILRSQALSEVDQLEFLDEYPRTTIRLTSDKVLFQDQSELIQHFKRSIAGLSTQ
jgi:hypothetical protein